MLFTEESLSTLESGRYNPEHPQGVSVSIAKVILVYRLNNNSFLKQLYLVVMETVH